MDLATAGKGSMSHSLTRVAALAAAAVITLVSAPRAQQPSFSSGAKTVAVYATVTNAQGRLAPDLTRDDFSIDHNGKRQELTVFSNDVQPITGVMLLHRSGRKKPNFELQERAAESIVHAL